MNKPAIAYEKFNVNWSLQFEELKSRIFPCVSKYVNEILHVGSTSIKGMSAKPIIDIDLVVDDLKYLDEIKKELFQLGYEYKGDLGIKDRVVFSCTQSKIQHHLYLIIENSIAFRNHLFLKRHLENNIESFNKYESLKGGLSESSSNRETYWRSKTEFILSCLRKEGMPDSEIEVIKAQNI
jgi:GrpB-like predicted nucleotidyltransferase (UPF0157 family)